MKRLLLFLLLPICAHSQLTTQIKIGWATEFKKPIISPAFTFTKWNVSLATEMVVVYGQDTPASFGMRASYTYSFLEAGVGYYYDLYSTDKERSYLNGYSKLAFIALHYKIAFVEADTKGNLFIGLKYSLQ